MSNAQQNYDAGIERAAGYIERASLPPGVRRHIAAEIRALKVVPADHVIEEDRGLGQMLIMAIDDKAKLVDALRPFAALADNTHEHFNGEQEALVKIKHLRAARAAIVDVRAR